MRAVRVRGGLRTLRDAALGHARVHARMHARVHSRVHSRVHLRVLPVVPERGLIHRPHVHRDGPVGLDDLLPNAGKDYLAIGGDQVIVTFLDVRTDDIDVQEGLLDELLHALK